VIAAALFLLAANSLTLSAQQGRTPEESLRLAQNAVEAGDLDGARQIAVEAFGADVFALPDVRPPRITQSLLRVRNARGQRVLALSLVDADGGKSAAATAREAADAIGSRAPVVVAGPALTVTLAYADTPELLAAQDRLAAALPRQPELALLGAALSTRYLAWSLSESLVSLESGYRERVDLAPAVRVWDGEAAKLDAAADKAQASGDALDQVRAAVWRGDARLWRELSALSRATYEVQVDEQGSGPDWLVTRAHEFYREGSLHRQWTIRPGETRQLEASILGWRYDRLVLAAALALVATAIVFVVAALIVR
jgi:hypothetical protein